MYHTLETTSNRGGRMRTIFFLLSILFFYLPGIAVTSPNELTILDRNTWSFSRQETEILNRLGVDVLDKKVMSILKDATGYFTAGKLVEFRVTDLNDDGIMELLARIDYSGRGLIRDVTVLSRNAGKYYYETIPADGTKITLLQDTKPNLIVGSSPLLELTRVDPIPNFPMLYSWSGSRCKDVSRENRSYYEAQYLPALTNAICNAQAVNLPGKGEQKRHLMIEATGWALATEKLALMFSECLISTNEVTKLNSLMKTINEDSGQEGVLVEKFREAHRHLRDLSVSLEPRKQR